MSLRRLHSCWLEHCSCRKFLSWLLKSTAPSSACAYLRGTSSQKPCSCRRSHYRVRNHELRHSHLVDAISGSDFNSVTPNERQAYMTPEEIREVLAHYSDEQFDDRTINALVRLVSMQPMIGYSLKLALALTPEGPNPQQRRLFASYIQEAVRLARDSRWGVVYSRPQSDLEQSR